MDTELCLIAGCGRPVFQIGSAIEFVVNEHTKPWRKFNLTHSSSAPTRARVCLTCSMEPNIFCWVCGLPMVNSGIYLNRPSTDGSVYEVCGLCLPLSEAWAAVLSQADPATETLRADGYDEFLTGVTEADLTSVVEDLFWNIARNKKAVRVRLVTAAVAGDLEALQQLHADGAPLSGEISTIAMRRGYPKMLEWLYLRRAPCPNRELRIWQVNPACFDFVTTYCPLWCKGIYPEPTITPAFAIENSSRVVD